jgi:hypothetical protein
MKIADQAAKDRARIEEELAHVRTLEELAKTWPDLDVKRAHIHASHARAVVVIEATSRGEALDIMRGFDLVTIGVKRNGCTDVRPDPDEELEERHGKITWEFDPSSYASVKAMLRGWATTSMGIIRVEVHITNDPARIEDNHIRNDSGSILQYRWRVVGSPYGTNISWASGQHGKPGRRTSLLDDEDWPGALTYDQQLER